MKVLAAKGGANHLESRGAPSSWPGHGPKESLMHFGSVAPVPGPQQARGQDALGAQGAEDGGQGTKVQGGANVLGKGLSDSVLGPWVDGDPQRQGNQG